MRRVLRPTAKTTRGATLLTGSDDWQTHLHMQHVLAVSFVVFTQRQSQRALPRYVYMQLAGASGAAGWGMAHTVSGGLDGRHHKQWKACIKSLE